MADKGRLGYDEDSDSGYVLLKGNDDRTVVKIGVVDDQNPGSKRGSVSVMMESGASAVTTRARLWISDKGAGTGRLELKGKSNRTLVRAGVSESIGQFGPGDYGTVTVHDGSKSGSPAVITLDGSTGAIQAKRLDVDDVYARRVIVRPPISSDNGLPIAEAQIPDYSIVGKNLFIIDQKNFAVPHPTNRSAEIHYGALEGPETPIFTRGQIRLKKGRGFAPLPEHFRLLSRKGSVTCSVTSRSAMSKGVSVVRLTPGYISVRENSRGQGNYTVDYVVFATRRTKSTFRVVRPIR
ncbi:MAG: hypothetical protein ACRD88_09185 [Terriglobia bacterium]